MARLYVIMGVAGSGKTSVGTALASALGGTYIDGDDFHPQSNIDKMSHGHPLNDEDRWPWLEIVAKELAGIKGIGIVGCSALKKIYRNLITEKAEEDVTFLYLSGSKELITKRMAAREGHFMPTALLESQLQTLEVPDDSENKIIIDIDAELQQIVESTVNQIKTHKEG